jgi:hypothetical protein
MTAMTLMATLLNRGLVARGFPAPSIVECEEILRNVIDLAAELTEKPVERQQPEMEGAT